MLLFLTFLYNSCFYRPSTKDIEGIVKLLDAGMTMARINLSHGSQKENLLMLNKFKQAKRLRPYMNCALMVEIRGREVRMSHNTDKSGQLRVRSGSTVIMSSGAFEQPSDATNFRINSEEIIRYLKPNDVVYVDDGRVVGVVKGINDEGVQLDIKIGGAIKSFAAVRFT